MWLVGLVGLGYCVYLFFDWCVFVYFCCVELVVGVFVGVEFGLVDYLERDFERVVILGWVLVFLFDLVYDWICLIDLRNCYGLFFVLVFCYG